MKLIAANLINLIEIKALHVNTCMSQPEITGETSYEKQLQVVELV